MAIRNSNNYTVVIVPETTYGEQVKNLSTGVAFPDTLNWNYEPIVTEQTKKENSLYKHDDRELITGKMVTGSLSGDLRDTHEILLKAHFDDASSPYLYPAQLGATNSYNVYKLYTNAAGECTAYDVILGAIFNPLSITGEANAIIQYSATIDGADFLENTANTSGAALSNIPAVGGACFLFGNITAAMFTGETAINSFSIELSKTLVDNALRFQNSLTKTNDRYTQVGGTLQFETIYDNSTDSEIQNTRYNTSATGSTSSVITLANTVKTWEIAICGLVTAAETPDTDRGILLGNYTLDLRYDTAGAAVPVTITVASV